MVFAARADDGGRRRGQDRGRGPRAVRRAAARRRRHRPPAAGRHRPRRGPRRCAGTAATPASSCSPCTPATTRSSRPWRPAPRRSSARTPRPPRSSKAARHAAVSPRSFLCAGLAEAVHAAGHARQPTQLTDARARRADAARRRAQRRRDRRPAPPQRVDREVPRRARSTRSWAPPTAPRRWSPRCGSGCSPACSPRPDRVNHHIWVTSTDSPYRTIGLGSNVGFARAPRSRQHLWSVEVCRASRNPRPGPTKETHPMLDYLRIVLAAHLPATTSAAPPPWSTACSSPASPP